ncbi:MAG: asparagine synthase (glutamine-hydrolyzing) [Flavobacteriales bacterium]|nr:asparagine synthase (glutamine-hydrolyzing) [Flavobacteriales bacterium]
MCGISGFFNYSNGSIQNGEGLIRKMNGVMEHRGPDDSGVWANEKRNVFLGHQRLSILDLSSAGHQPMHSSQCTNTIVFNGEIYNYKELKKQLKINDFQSNSDTEVLLELYAEEKKSFLSELRGMFAFSIWNEEKQQLRLARDRAGQKPLYYTIQNEIFAFSSQLKSLFELPWVKRELDEEALYHFLTFNHLVPPFTMFKGIHKFEPGHEMIVGEAGILSYKPYWKLDLAPTVEKSKILEDKVYEDLERSVEYRMISDVPVGAFLSGGVDSSAIVAMMSKRTTTPIKTYSIGFEGQSDYDELAYAREVAELFGTEHIEKVVKAEDFKRLLPEIVEIFDEPIADSTCIPIYFLSQLAKENGTKVILTGDGADELFGGYSNWIKYNKIYPYYQAYGKLPKVFRKGLSTLYGKYNKASPTYEMLKRSEKHQDFFWSGAKGFKESTKNDFLTDGFLLRTATFDSFSVIEDLKKEFNSLNQKEESDYINWLCFTGLRNIIPNLYANRLDKLTMAHSVEGRSPFLDHDIIQNAFSIRGGLKIREGEAKYILKKSLERLLPNEVLYRKKQGFCVPLKEWGTDIMVEYLEEELGSFCSTVDIFKEDKLRAILEKVKSGKSNNINMLWTIYFLIQWYNKWMRNE